MYHLFLLRLPFGGGGGPRNKGEQHKLYTAFDVWSEGGSEDEGGSEGTAEQGIEQARAAPALLTRDFLKSICSIRHPFSKACLQHFQAVIQPSMVSP